MRPKKRLIANILIQYAKNAPVARIAKAIVRAREDAPITKR